MGLRTVGLRIWLSAACTMFPIAATAQQATGTIGGTVQDASGAVMPGVTITLASPGIIGGNQTAVTDGRGTYQFVRLVPASYSVRAELQGFRTALRENVVVNADVTARVDLTIEVGSLAETITVSGAAPMLDTTTTQNQAVMDRKLLDAIPSGNSVWAIGAMVPALLQTKIDVGGVESFMVSAPKVHGSLDAENRYMIDGMWVGSPQSGGGSLFAYYDTLMFQEVNYQVGQSPAESGQGGVVMNMVTKTGTNLFRSTVDVTGSHERLMSKNISPDQRRDLLAGVPAQVLKVNPGIEPSNAVPWIYDAGASFSGPIKRDRLWYVFTLRRQAVDQIQTGSYNPDGTLARDDNEIKNASIKISWQMSANNQLHGLYNRNQKWRFHRRSNDFPGALFVEDRATVVQDMPTDMYQLKWTSVLSSRMMLDIGGTWMVSLFHRNPQPEVQPGDMPRLDLVTLVGSVANPYYIDQRPDNRGLYTSLSYVAGAHNLKFGYTALRGSWQNTWYSTSHYPTGLLARYRSGVPDSVIVYNTPFDTTTVAVDHAVYAQDRWTPVRKLTLNLGLRFQSTTGFVPAVCQPENIFLSGQCYGRIEHVPDYLDLSPRFGLTYDLFGDGKTALKVAANRYMLGGGTGYGDRVNPLTSASSTRPWTDTNGDLIPQLSELGVGTGFNLGATNRYADVVEQPYANELSAEVEHQLWGDVVVSLGYFYRAVRRDIGSRNLLVPASGYIPLQVTERVSGRQVTVYNQAPATRGLFDVVYDNYDEMNTDFNGFDINFNKRMSNRWMVMGGLALGKNTGDTYGDTSDLNNPNFTFRQGLVTRDTPVTFKLSGIYDAPFGIRLSGSYQYYTGIPESTTVQVTSQTVALTQVTQSLRVEDRGGIRLPSNNIANLRIAKVLRFAGRGQVTPALDIFNLTNSNTVQEWSAQLGPAYHRTNNILRPRMFRVGLNMTF